MKNFIPFVSGFALCALLVVSMGAWAGDEYDRACLNVQGEYSAYLWLLPDKSPEGRKRLDACKARAMHWVQIMEQFKP